MPTLAMVVMIALTLFLANWQLDRADQKRALQARYDLMQKDPAVTLPGKQADSTGLLYQKVALRGRFDFVHEIYIDNKLYRGRAGYYVITPFRDDNSGSYVLVNRGWLAAGSNRAIPPMAAQVPGQIRIEGIVTSPNSRYLELSAATVQGRVWENLHFKRYATTLPYAVQAVLIQQINDTQDGLVRVWDRPDAGAAMHMGYAVQWFAIATAILIIYLVLNVKRVPI
ncbi:SURF1 family protein [Sulfuriferula plumbiphila]|uniref:SURF1 family protein n=1 Tax=Sulfuriferula plumbiphila TaxID=171865 RepID=UPI001386BDC5|nr:SURF1 family protein [Sulfuriferula plumbiphila]